MLTAEGLRKSYGDVCLFDDLKLHVRAGDRIALIGDNGTGKSTLFKCLIAREKPDAGSIRWGAGVDIGYYDQHQAGLDENKTVLDEVWDRFPRLEQYEVRGALGQFLFSGDEVFSLAVRRGEGQGSPDGTDAAERQRAAAGRAHKPPGHGQPRSA